MGSVDVRLKEKESLKVTGLDAPHSELCPELGLTTLNH